MLHASRLSFIAPILLMCVVGTLPARAPAGQIRWASGDAALEPMTVNEISAFLRHLTSRVEPAMGGPATSGRHVVIQFTEPLSRQGRHHLAGCGITLLRYLGNHAFFAAVDLTRLDSLRVAQIPGLELVAAIRPEWKLHPMFLDGRPDVILDNSDPSDPVIAAYVLFHPDCSWDSVGSPLVAGHGGQVRSELWSINGLVIELPQSAVRRLAAEDAVQWIEPALPPMRECNNSNRALTQADVVQAAPYNLTGAGVNVLVYDGGSARATHRGFDGRLTVRDASPLSSHATHVAGTIGSGSTVNATYRGMAPGVTMQSYGFEWAGGFDFLYTDPGDLQNDYSEAITTHGVHISNNSIGNNTEYYSDCGRQGDYGVTDVLIDSIVRGAFGEPFRVVWANGNERGGTRCNVEGYGAYYSIAPPAGAKNHLTVGAVNSNNDTMTNFSSWGPTDDGRMKPDISAPGCQTDDDGGVTSCLANGDGSYGPGCGTSMASPTACGLAALLLEDFRNQFPGRPDFRNSTLRILLAHTAQDRYTTGPDYQFGYGSVRVQKAVNFLRLGHFMESQVDHGQSRRFILTAPAEVTEVRITLAWDDVPGTPNVNPALVNDLDLVVRDPSGVQRFPWTLNPTSPSAPAVRNAPNRRDNIEQVLYQGSVTGAWAVEVFGFSVPDGPQPFSICASYALLPECAGCDANCDGSINSFDVQPFIDTLSGGGGCSACAADANSDGSVNSFDIEAFIECLGG